MKWWILAIGFYFVGEDEAERVPHADVYGCARTSRLFYLFDDGSASLLVGEHCGEFTGPRLYSSQRASSVPCGTMVASRSGPVEIMPISTCRKSLMKRRYSTAALGNLALSFTP